MLKNFNLETKLNILLGMILTGVTVSVSVILSVILQTHVEEILSTKASLLMEMMNSVRQYTITEINPELSLNLETEKFFIPQTVPAYSAREVFANFTDNNPEYENFSYKEAAGNPTNPENKADLFEAQIIKSFIQNLNKIDREQGFHILESGEKLFYLARPIIIKKQSCLKCHGNPDDAPLSQIATYGRENGFGWKMNQVVGTQIISLPAGKIQDKTHSFGQIVIGSTVILIVLGIILLNIFIRITIINPIHKISFLSKKISIGNLNVDFKHNSRDEIGILSLSFNRIKDTLVLMSQIIDEAQNIREKDEF